MNDAILMTEEQRRAAFFAHLANVADNFVCTACGGRKVVCIDDGGASESGDWTDYEISAWQCTSCFVMTGLSFDWGDE